jgi:carboxypeptidase PM20D1
MTICRYIWGRGALDVKFSAACILEALTLLVQAGKVPKRTIMLAVGHDEEVRVLMVEGHRKQ